MYRARKKQFKAIKHLLPAGCWAAERSDLNPGGFEEEYVIHITGNHKLENLDLDYYAKGTDGTSDKGPVYLYLIEGDLYAKNIFCEDTDGASGLIVLGNLEAGNMVVGGQEIYVKGNLKVKELFWGNYNHGGLKVRGNIAAKVFVATDYHFDFKRFRNEDRVQVDHWLWDETEEEGFPREHLERLFRPECLVDETELIDGVYSWEDRLRDWKMLERLREGLPLLLDNLKGYVHEEEPIPFVFESTEFNDTNLKRLRESPVFLDRIPGDVKDRIQKVEYWRGDKFKRILVVKDQPEEGGVYFEYKNKALLIQCEEEKPNYIQKLQGRKSRWKVAVLCRTIEKGKKKQWYYYDPKLPAHDKFKEMTQPLWEDLLREWSEIEYWQKRFHDVVTPDKIAQILALPLVREKYSDYYNDDAGDLWIGNYVFHFRQADNPKGHDPRISISLQLDAKKELFDFNFYDITALRNETTGALLYTQDTNAYDSNVHEVNYGDIKKCRNAVRYFQLLEKHIFKLNEAYVSEKQPGVPKTI